MNSEEEKIFLETTAKAFEVIQKNILLLTKNVELFEERFKNFNNRLADSEEKFNSLTLECKRLQAQINSLLKNPK